MNVKLGERDVVFPSPYLTELEESSSNLENVVQIRQRLQTDGYLFFRRFFNAEAVNDAKLAVLNHLRDVEKKEKRTIYDESKPWNRGILDHRCGRGCVPFMEGKNSVTHSAAVMNLIESPVLFRFFENLFGEPVRTFDYKWLRAMYKTGFTGAHVDNVYMGRGSRRVLTVWIPFGDVSVDMGTLTVNIGSHSLPEFETFQNSYGNLDVQRAKLKGTGWFTTDPFEITQKFGGQWATANFKAGDLVMFTMRTIHMSTTNLTHYARISCDCRFQPKLEPADERYQGDITVNESDYGTWSEDKHEEDNSSAYPVTMEGLRRIWNI